MNSISETEKEEKKEIYPEVIGVALCAVGILLLCTNLEAMIKQAVCVIAGIIGYEILSSALRRDKLTSLMCILAAILGLGLLAANFIMGESENGAQNWLTVRGWRFQPSELVKVCMAIQAAGLKKDSLSNRFFVFTVFSAIAVIIMAFINDFGTALIFFIAYLAAAIECGKFSIAGLAAISATGAGYAAVKLKPHIAARFISCGRAWENVATTGYQQTRTMIAVASGGLFGVGLGKGWLRNVIAADTDMVFGIVCEEMGLAIGAIIIFMIMFICILPLIKPSGCGAVTAAVILMVQMAFNVLGSLDIIPFTGVTFPFISRGGTSILACWGLLAIISGDLDA